MAVTKVKKLAFINGKGGCGKTTSIFHVSGVLSKGGSRVLVVDLDKQRNTTETLLMNTTIPAVTVYDVMCSGAEPRTATASALFQRRGNANPRYYGVDCMVSDERLEDEASLNKIDATRFGEALDGFLAAKCYDWLLVDMPPSSKALNDICFCNVVDYLIVPFTSDFFSIQGYGDLITTVQRARVSNPKLNNLGVYLSRYMPNCSLDRAVRNMLMEGFSKTFIDVQIPLAADIREAVAYGRPISYYREISKSRRAYESLVGEIVRRIESTERQD